MDDTRPPKLEVYRDKNVALEYDRRWSGSLGAKRDKRKASAITKAFKLLSKHHAIQFQSVLDIPCGTGRFSNLLDQFGCKTTGADLSDEMLEQARLKHPQHEYLTADMATIPFADDTFDIGMCIRLLHLVHSPALRVKYLTELRRVCKYGAIIDYRHSHTVRIFSRKMRFHLGVYDELPQLPSPRQIQQELKLAGFAPLSKINVHFAPYLSDKLIFPVIPDAFC